MASAQAMCVNEKQEKEMVQQMVEKAKSVGLSKHNNLAVNQSQGSAVVSMGNSTTAMVNFNKNYDWSGKIIGGSYPPTILSDSSATFTHAGVSPNGSSGAVIYYGTNKQGTSCAWLLAWSAPTNVSASTPNKVYVDCGLSSNFGPTIDWSVIQAKLNTSDAYNNHYDPVTMTNISAQISPSNGFAAVGANFAAL